MDLNTEFDIFQGNLKSLEISLPFKEAIDFLNKRFCRVISLEELAKLRIKEGAESKLFSKGYLVREAIIYDPERGRFISKNSPLLEDSERVHLAHSCSQKYFLTPEQLEFALEDSVEVSPNLSYLAQENFAESTLANFCFGKETIQYGNFLRENGVSNIFLHLDRDEIVRRRKLPYATQIRISKVTPGIKGSSSLVSREDLTDKVRVRGIKYSQE